MPSVDDRLKSFAYLNAEKASLYRAIMALFLDAKAHFEIHLGPVEILQRLHQQGGFLDGELTDEIEGALVQLCNWGNLQRTQDTSEVRTVEEFYQPRYLYQLTREGEAAERAVHAYEEAVLRPGELQTAALGVIRDQLHALASYARDPELDPRKVHVALSTLNRYFDQLTTKAQQFIGSIQRAIDLQGYDLEEFIAYKKRLIEYLERFVGELVVAADEISEIIQDVEQSGVGPILRAAAEHDLGDAMHCGDREIEFAEHEWRLRWAGFKKWFLSGPDSPSQAEALRSCARSAIPSLLIAVSGIHDRRVASGDRPTDLKLLARWFAQADSDADAHRLWRAAFALNPARHLCIDDDTLAARDQAGVSPTTSWVDAGPLLISPRLRQSGRRHRRGRPANVIDRSEDKRRLAALAKREAEQAEQARRRLATGRQMRLSQLGELERDEFQLFLDLLGKALSRQRVPCAQAAATSSDGSLQITLKPTEDDRQATIITTDGEFHGHDYYVEITDVASANQPALEGPVASERSPVADESYQTAGASR